MGPHILFMGSSEFSAPILKRLSLEGWNQAVITQPDKPTGRGKKLESPVVKNIAELLHLPIYQPRKLFREEMVSFLDTHEIDMIVVAAYGKILPSWMLEYTKYGALNVHASLLPRWRGASPIQAAILHGDPRTGVTIMKIDEGLDTGDILTQESLEISKDDTAGSLSEKLSSMGADLLVETIEEYIEGKINPQKQNPENATMTRLIRKDDGRLDFQEPAEKLERKIRAYNPWPICFYEWDSESLRIYDVEITSDITLKPNQRGEWNKFPCVGTGTKTLILKTVQSPGRSRMDGRSFLNGTKDWYSEFFEISTDL
jgi:methionyl-tRNA formyltransferase